jgi:hypothetical protein
MPQDVLLHHLTGYRGRGQERFKRRLRDGLWCVSINGLEIFKMMDWVPVVFVTFKVLVLGIGMFFAIKWHYDQGKKAPDRAKETRAVLRAGGKVAAVFVVSLVGLGFLTFDLARTLGLELTLP